jgi:hypothetical protein
MALKTVAFMSSVRDAPPTRIALGRLLFSSHEQRIDQATSRFPELQNRVNFIVNVAQELFLVPLRLPTNRGAATYAGRRSIIPAMLVQ